MDTVGPWELLIIVVVLVAVFGSSQLPRTARSLGEGCGSSATPCTRPANPWAGHARPSTVPGGHPA